MAATEGGSANNYQIPTGKVYFTPEGGARYFFGNCIDFGVSNSLQTREHKRNYGGVRTVDKKSITEAGATAKFSGDEIIERNLAMIALGTPVENTDGSFRIIGVTETEFKGFLEVEGDNNDGPVVDWKGNVQLIPSGEYKLIKNDDEENQIEIEAQVLANDDNVGFGEWTYWPDGVTPVRS